MFWKWAYWHRWRNFLKVGLLTHVGLRILKISLLTHFKLTNLKKCSYVCLRVFKHIFDHLCFKVSSKQNDLFKLQIPTEKLINYKRTFYNNWFYPIISKLELYRSKICSKNKKKIPNVITRTNPLGGITRKLTYPP